MNPKATIRKNLKRRSLIVDKDIKYYQGLPLPTWIELSLIDVCNRSCSFCPKSDPKIAPDTYQKMGRSLIDKLTAELKKIKYRGSIALCGYGEPLLHKDILYITRKLSETASVEIVTNGDALNPDRLKKLYDAGLTTLLISVYDGPKEAESFLKMMKRINIDKSRYVIRNRYYGEDKDFGITLSNRAGNLNNAEFKIEPLKESLKMKCTYPSYTFFIDYNGDVLMCPQDWGKK